MGFSFENKRQVGLLIVLVVLIWLVFPFLFKAVMFWMGWVGVDLATFAEYGPVGDIYGSLNTLFTSATLAFVIYSTILQRQANKDARVAMADQLQQAKDATAEQLQQAKNATNEQLQQARDALVAQLNQAKVLTEQQITNANELANIQLEQARESMEQQLALAQATHDAQMKESKYSIFSNVFHSLLNQKHSRYLSIQTKKNDIQYIAQEIFTHIDHNFYNNLNEKWGDFDKLTKDDIEQDYYDIMGEISNSKNYSEIFGYFKGLIDLYELIRRAELEEEDKHYFRILLRNTLTTGEQSAIFWIGAFRKDVSYLLHKEKIFNLKYDDYFMPFIVKFYKKECFSNKLIIENWDRFDNK